MEIIKNLVQTLIIIVVLAVFLEMLLPWGKMAPYIKMVMGLMIIIAVLQAISGLLQQNWLQDVPGVTARPGEPGPPLEDIMAAGKQLQLKNQDLALEKYRQGISGQVLALAKLNPGARVVDADVTLSQKPGEQSYGRIKKITLIIDPWPKEEGDANNTGDDIRPVNITIGQPAPEKSDGMDREIPLEIKREARRVAQSVTGFYNLSPEQVLIEYRKV